MLPATKSVIERMMLRTVAGRADCSNELTAAALVGRGGLAPEFGAAGSPRPDQTGCGYLPESNTNSCSTTQFADAVVTGDDH
jgi:hypothetical protein